MKKIILNFLFPLLILNAQAQNYDESKVPPYTLPDALKSASGKRIVSTKDWENVRRPEIAKLFEDNIYGQMPQRYDSIRYVVASEDEMVMNGNASLKQIVVEVFNKGKSVKINVTLFLPKKVEGPIPVFLLINNRGKENTDPTRTKKSGFWPAELAIESGYGIAAFHVSDLAPDDQDTFANGVLRLYPGQLTAENGMRAIGAWAWGASRVMDYFETDKDINAKQVIVVGHSRGGKASLWAAAQDKRFAICVSNCSGNTGIALARRQYGERISKINAAFPHWFTPNYKKFNDREASLPVDQHMLAALVAPRPLYATNASKDLWADPMGTFLSLKNVENVYQLYHSKSNLPSQPPPIDTPVFQSVLGYHNREGIHDMTEYDWANFIQFANYHFKK